MMFWVYTKACFGDIKGIMNPIAFKNAPKDLSLCNFIPSYRGINTTSNDSIPYGADASANAEIASAAIIFTFLFSSDKPFFTV